MATHKILRSCLQAALILTFTLAAPGWIAPAKAADLDPSRVIYQHPDQIKWKGGSASQQAVLLGDPSKPGLYIILIKWNPHHFSHPHFHPNDRYATVLSGTWWVSSSDKYDPENTVAMPAGSFVTDLAKGIHFDGAKDEPTVIEIVGMGPATSTSAEKK